MEKKKTQKLSRREFLKVGAGRRWRGRPGVHAAASFRSAPRSRRDQADGSCRDLLHRPRQDLYKKQAAEWDRRTASRFSADFLNWPRPAAKIAAAIQAGGVDIVELWPSWNYLYRNNLVT